MIWEVLSGVGIALGILLGLFLVLGVVNAITKRLAGTSEPIKRMPRWAKVVLTVLLMMLVVWQTRYLLQSG